MLRHQMLEKAPSALVSNWYLPELKGENTTTTYRQNEDAKVSLD